MKKISLKPTMIAASVISVLGFGGCKTTKQDNSPNGNNNRRHIIDREQIIDDIGTVKPLYAAPRPPRERITLPNLENK